MPHWGLWETPLLLADKTTPAEDKGPPRSSGVVRGQWEDEDVGPRTPISAARLGPPVGRHPQPPFHAHPVRLLLKLLPILTHSIACLVTEAEKVWV